MSKRSKNKHRTPRRVDPLGGLRLISQRQIDELPLDDEQQQDIGLSHWLAFNNITQGTQPTADDWATLASTINMALLLAELGHGYDEQELFQRAQAALYTCRLRGDRTNIWRLNGGDIEAVRIALDLHDQQLVACTHAEMGAALDELQARLDRGCIYQPDLQAA